MNKLILYLFFSFAATVACSQKIYFVYLQSESEQPFFVKVNERMHTSTGSGYLILPRLKDSTYTISIGFPENKWPEQVFSVTINKKDRGYLLKNFGEKGWGLFDLQNLSVQMAVGGKAAVENNPSPVNKDVSAFTDILSKAADDPSLKEKPIRPKAEEKKEVVVVQQPVKKEEPVTIKEPVTTKPAATTETVNVKKEEPVLIKEPVVTKPATTTETVNVKKEEPVINKEPVVTKPDVITETVAAKKDEPKVEPVNTKPAETKAVAVVNKEEVKEQPAEPAIIKKETEETYTRSEVKRAAESSNVEGYDLLFIDSYNGKKDTIRLLIPNPKPLVDPVNAQPKEEKKFLEISNDVTKKEEPVKPDVKNDIPVKEETPTVTSIKPVTEEPAKQTQPETVKKDEVKPVTTEATSKQPVTNSCPATAGESDFLKLRRKMAAVDNDDDMVSEARKYFKTTCFTVYQIRNLGTLFLTDEGKYKFFDAAYAHTADVHNFISLQLELKEGYYIKRFKAMLK